MWNLRRGARRTEPDTQPRPALERGLALWRDLGSAEAPDDQGTTAAFIELLRVAQRAAALPKGAELLAAGYLLAAEIMRSTTTPIDAAIRFVGLAAVALDRARGSEGELIADDPIRRRFREARGRLRGSIFVPRDVESVFAGRVEALETTALSPASFATVQTLFNSGIQAARLAAALEKTEGSGLARRDTAAREVKRGAPLLSWRPEDRQFIADTGAMIGGD